MRKRGISKNPNKSTQKEKDLILSLKKELIKRNLKKRKFPIRAVISCTVFFALALVANSYQSEIIDFIDRVEVSSLPISKAETEAAKEDKDSTVKKKSRAGWTAEEISLFEGLEKRKVELDAREKQLNDLQAELDQQKKEIEEKIGKLANIRQKISSELEEQIESDESKIKKLVEVYSGMKPQSAAIVFEDIDEELAIKILGSMKKNNAASILNLLKPEKARRLSEKYAGYIK